MNLNFNDFQKQDIKFDINELKKAYNEVLTIKGFTGIDAPYEAPKNPELIIESDKYDVDTCAEKIVDFLIRKNIINK